MIRADIAVARPYAPHPGARSMTPTSETADPRDTGSTSGFLRNAGTERLAVVPTSVRRSATGFEAELAGPLRGRLVYSLSGSVLTLELRGSNEVLPTDIAFELPNAAVSLHAEDRFVGMAGSLNGSHQTDRVLRCMNGIRFCPLSDHV